MIQQEYAYYQGNRTWEKAIEYYANGNLEEAYKTLGFVMHLVEDMTVPEHSRDDTHAHELEKFTGDYGSPYEEYTKKYTRGNLTDIAVALKAAGLMPPEKRKIDDYLIELAQYSNRYFFTKDTINDPKYQFPKVIREDENFGYGIDDGSKEFPLVKVDFNADENNEVTKVYSIKKVQEHYPILDAYFSRLSRKAVLYGAGVIELFHKQAEDAIVNKGYQLYGETSILEKLVPPLISPFGELVKLKSLWDSAQSFVSSIFYLVQNAALLVVNPPSETSVEQSTLALAPTEETPLPPEGATLPPPPPPEPESEQRFIDAIRRQLAAMAAQLEAMLEILGEAVAPAGPAEVSTNIAGLLPAAGLTFGGAPPPPSETASSGGGGGEGGESAESSTSTPPAPAITIRNFSATYHPAPRIELSFEAESAGGATSTTYTIRDISNPSEPQNILELSTSSASSTVSHALPINEVGRSYQFELSAQDTGGASSTAAAQLTAPSFLDKFSFYRDPRVAERKYLADFTASSSRPFFDLADASLEQNFKLIAPYLNKDAPKQAELSTFGRLQPDDPAFVRLRYNSCHGGTSSNPNLLLPWNRHSCQPGGVLSSALHVDQIASPLRVELDHTGAELSSSDFITLAFYDFVGGFGGGEQRFSLAAVDKTQYRLGEPPPELIPPPGPTVILEQNASGAADEGHLNSTGDRGVGQTFATSTNATISSIDVAVRTGFAFCSNSYLELWDTGSAADDATSTASWTLVASSTNAVSFGSSNQTATGRYELSNVPIVANRYYWWGVFSSPSSSCGGAMRGSGADAVPGRALIANFHGFFGDSVFAPSGGVEDYYEIILGPPAP